MAYSVYLDDILLPVTPSKINLNVNGQNKTYSLINDGEINILKYPKLSTIEFDALIPQVEYPFAVYPGGFKPAVYYTEELKRLISEAKPFNLLISRQMPGGQELFYNRMKVSLESYTIKDDAKEGFDIIISISLKEYREYKTQTKLYEAGSDDTYINAEPERETAGAPNPSIGEEYTVKSGDTLWHIAKHYYGDGAAYSKIAEANKDTVTNPNLIYPGQVLNIPMGGA